MPKSASKFRFEVWEIPLWSGVCCALALLLLTTPEPKASGGAAALLARAEFGQAKYAGWALGLLALLSVAVGKWLSPWLNKTRNFPHWVLKRPYTTLFLASFTVLFVEVLLIRYCGAQIRIFAFYKNIPLIGAFLGLGLGCYLSGAKVRHVFSFLFWLIPLAFFLAFGSSVVDGHLGRIAAETSSELILGDVSKTNIENSKVLLGQVLMGLFCSITLAAITFLFTFLGRLMGTAFEAVPRLPGYTVNIVASLLGILAFTLLSFLWTPPPVWFFVGLLPLFWWLPSRRVAMAAGMLMVVSIAAVTPSVGDVVWSSYQKLVGKTIPPGEGGTGTISPGYLVQISDVFYQAAVDLRPEVVAPLKGIAYPHYNAAFSGLGQLERVLVVGAGTGNDVAAALRAGSARVDAVDIDRAIIKMGLDHHPERPYDDPRTHLIIDDARRAFGYLPQGSYDAVVFGLLDSHTQLGISSVRLDNYVFTMESLEAARRLLKPGGHIIVTAATFQDWFRDRFMGMLSANCSGEIQVAAFGPWHSYRCRVEEPTAPPQEVLGNAVMPTDDWPFLYLPNKVIPLAYVVVVGLLMLVSVLVLKVGGLKPASFGPYSLHLFFMGAAFLLMEVAAINRLALLFGTTWIVSAVTISLILTLIVAANQTVLWTGGGAYGLAYAGLIVSLLVGYGLQPSVVLGKGMVAGLGYALLTVSPIFFAGLVFARSFSLAKAAGPAIGTNILGAVLGGWLEYSTMAIGIRSLSLLALALYLASFLFLQRSDEYLQETVVAEGER